MTKQVFDYIRNTFQVEPEFLWAGSPDAAAFRNKRNKKWFAAFLGKTSKRKLGIDSDETVDIINLKCDPLMSFSVVDRKRIFPGYHMNKEHWISVLLDGSVPMEELQFLIGNSYELIDMKARKTKNT